MFFVHLFAVIGLSACIGVTSIRFGEEVHNTYQYSEKVAINFDYSFNTNPYFSQESDYYALQRFNYDSSTQTFSTDSYTYGYTLPTGVSYTSSVNSFRSIAKTFNTQWDLVVRIDYEYQPVSVSFDYFYLTFWFGNYFSGCYINPNESVVVSRTQSNTHPLTLECFDSTYDSSDVYFSKCFVSSDSLHSGGYYAMNSVPFLYKYSVSPSHGSTFTGYIDISFVLYYEKPSSNTIVNEGIYENGYNDGYSNGEYEGYKNGYSEGYELGSEVGYQNGYRAGVNTQPLTMDFLTMLGAIGDTPIYIIRNLFDFELFGISALTVFMTLLTASLVIYFIRKIL